MDYVLAVDGGNTKTLALIARLDGTIVGSSRGGSTNIYVGDSTTTSIAELQRSVEAALAAAAITPSALSASCFSMAGADWDEDIALLTATVQNLGYGRNVLVVNDAIGGLRAGSPSGWGVVVVCGTSAAVGARTREGRSWHSGYWQQPEGAEDLANQMLKAVYRTALGIDPPTRLTERVLAHFGQPTVEAVLHMLTARGARPTRHGGLARALLDEAHAGDETARRIVTAHGAALGDFALAAARQVGIEHEPFPLVLAGSVLRHPSQLLNETIVARVRRSAPNTQPVERALEPVCGALMLALEAAGVRTDAATIARIVATLPPTAFFAT